MRNRARSIARAARQTAKRKAAREAASTAGSRDKLGRYLCLKLADALDRTDPNHQLLRRVALALN